MRLYFTSGPSIALLPPFGAFVPAWLAASPRLYLSTILYYTIPRSELKEKFHRPRRGGEGGGPHVNPEKSLRWSKKRREEEAHTKSRRSSGEKNWSSMRNERQITLLYI